MSAAERLKVSVAYATASEQIVVALELPVGATLADAIAASGLGERFDLGDLNGRTGIYGRLRPLQQALGDGDRVEIYRPLLADPKDARRQRAGSRRRR